jgi:hypothetical protein
MDSKDAFADRSGMSWITYNHGERGIEFLVSRSYSWSQEEGGQLSLKDTVSIKQVIAHMI